MKVCEVIKIGGSLLAEPGAMRLIQEWLATTRERNATRLLIAGGGPVVDGLRSVDRANPLSAEASHWAAIRLMDANTRLLVDWLPGVEVSESLGSATPGEIAFVCHDWLREEEPRLPGERLESGGGRRATRSPRGSPRSRALAW